MQIADFLTGYRPFNLLEADELAQMAAASRAAEHESGSVIVDGFLQRIDELAVVVSGQLVPRWPPRRAA